MLKSRKIKIIIFIIFLLIVIGGGFILSTRIDKNAIRKTGYKTKHNPGYIDSMVQKRKKSD